MCNLPNTATGRSATQIKARFAGIVSHMMDQFFARDLTTPSRLAAFARSEYAIGINPDTFRHTLQRGGGLKPCKGKPMAI
jgi:hypothetical protein